MSEKNKKNFEQAIERLQEISQEMESEKINFEKSLELYEEASKLLIYCKDELENSKGRIMEIQEKLQKKD